MSEYTPEQFARLPKWAQRTIEHQEGAIEELRRTLQVATGDVPETDIYFETWPMYGNRDTKRIYMPENRGRVFVDVGKGRYARSDQVTVAREDKYGLGGIMIQADSEIHLTMPSCNRVWLTPHSLNNKD